MKQLHAHQNNRRGSYLGKRMMGGGEERVGGLKKVGVARLQDYSWEKRGYVWVRKWGVGWFVRKRDRGGVSLRVGNDKEAERRDENGMGNRGLLHMKKGWKHRCSSRGSDYKDPSSLRIPL